MTYFRADREIFTREGKKEPGKMFTVISIDMYEARVLSRKKTMKVKTSGFFCLMHLAEYTWDGSVFLEEKNSPSFT